MQQVAGFYREKKACKNVMTSRIPLLSFCFRGKALERVFISVIFHQFAEAMYGHANIQVLRFGEQKSRRAHKQADPDVTDGSKNVKAQV